MFTLAAHRLLILALVALNLMAGCTTDHRSDPLGPTDGDESNAAPEASAAETEDVEETEPAPPEEADAQPIAEPDAPAAAPAPALDRPPAAQPSKPSAPAPQEVITHRDGVLLRLSMHEAPAPTRTFYWGKGKIAAPNFYVDPDDVLTMALDQDNRVRYLGWLRFPPQPWTFGDEPKDFPLNGQRHVELRPAYGCAYDVNVSQQASANQVSLRIDNSSSDCQSNYVQSLEATRKDDGWAVQETLKGKLFAANIDAHAEATLYDRDPGAKAPGAGEASVWSAPVELSAPGFAGPPVDHLTVSLDEQGNPRSFAFNNFFQHARTFGSGEQDFPLSGTRQVGTQTVTVDTAEEPSADHFVLRYHVQETAPESDYIEGIDGTREGGKLVIRYFIKGTLWTAKIDGHAAGALVPKSQP